MDFELGVSYTRPPASGASWFYDALGEVRRVRVGDVPVEIEILGGGKTVGLLDSVGDPPFGMHGGVSLDMGGETNLSIPCEDIAGFTLLSPGPPLDRSDELGR